MAMVGLGFKLPPRRSKRVQVVPRGCDNRLHPRKVLMRDGSGSKFGAALIPKRARPRSHAPTPRPRGRGRFFTMNRGRSVGAKAVTLRILLDCSVQATRHVSREPTTDGTCAWFRRCASAWAKTFGAADAVQCTRRIGFIADHARSAGKKKRGSRGQPLPSCHRATEPVKVSPLSAAPNE
jgi:hypothetical protein